MFYLKKNKSLQEKLMSPCSCEYCDSVGMLGIESIHTGSGADENILDKQIDDYCPECGRIIYY